MNPTEEHKNRWRKFDTFFINERLYHSKYDLYKGRVLATIQIFALAIILTTQILTVLTPENSIGFVVPIGISILLIYIFKKYGNLQISGNLLALGVACILVPMVFESGGLYSDNLLWLILCPLVCMLFSNRISVFVGLGGLIALATYLYIDFDASSMPNALNEYHQPTYYYISISLLYTVVVVVVSMFKKGEEDIIADLKRKQLELEFKGQALLGANKQLRQISEQLRASNSDLESFAYAASHDLKEPLRMIGSYTQLIQRRLNDKLTPDTREMMDFVKDGVNRMQKLLDDVLEYSRAGRSQDKYSSIDLEDVLYFIKSTLRLQLEEKNAAILTIVPLPTVHAQYSSMVQLFQNLISNAIKFSKDDVAPEIKISWEKSAHGFIRIAIADNGIGISKDYHDKVFNLFERLHYRQDYAGSGIGLSTCKKIVETLGGTIHIESTEQVGTTFFFTLPSSEEAYNNAMQASEQNQNAPTLYQNVEG